MELSEREQTAFEILAKLYGGLKDAGFAPQRVPGSPQLEIPDAYVMPVQRSESGKLIPGNPFRPFVLYYGAPGEISPYHTINLILRCYNGSLDGVAYLDVYREDEPPSHLQLDFNTGEVRKVPRSVREHLAKLNARAAGTEFDHDKPHA